MVLMCMLRIGLKRGLHPVRGWVSQCCAFPVRDLKDRNGRCGVPLYSRGSFSFVLVYNCQLSNYSISHSTLRLRSGQFVAIRLTNYPHMANTQSAIMSFWTGERINKLFYCSFLKSLSLRIEINRLRIPLFHHNIQLGLKMSSNQFG